MTECPPRLRRAACKPASARSGARRGERCTFLPADACCPRTVGATSRLEPPLFAARSVRPRTDADAVARAVGQRPVRWCVRGVDDSTARRERGLEPRRDTLARHGYIDVHRVTQRLRGIDLLHPHG